MMKNKIKRYSSSLLICLLIFLAVFPALAAISTPSEWDYEEITDEEVLLLFLGMV